MQSKVVFCLKKSQTKYTVYQKKFLFKKKFISIQVEQSLTDVIDLKKKVVE